MTAALAIGLVGAGTMGANHARVLAGLPGVTLAGIQDADGGRAAALAEKLGVAALPDLDALADRCDAVVVAASSAAHVGIAGHLLRRGKPCLVEKPLALTEADCHALIDGAEAAGLLLAVGHVERFNPAVAAVADALAGRTVRAMETRRFNPGSARITDTSVLADLMVHDIDAVLHLLAGLGQSGISELRALGDGDHASLGFRCGTVPVTCAASRLGPIRVRDLLVWTDDGMIQLDFLRRRASRTRVLDEAEPLAVAAGEPLARELSAFADAVRRGDPAGCVSGRQALDALRLVWAGEAALGLA